MWVDRFWGRVDVGDCWEWTGGVDDNGYGIFGNPGHADRGGSRFAHRIAWHLLVGPIPAGLCLDHLCRNPRCVNPDHLEPVTLAENVMRGVGHGPRNAAKTHCLRGHPLSGPNLYRARGGQRHCRACRAQNARQRREAKVRSDG